MYVHINVVHINSFNISYFKLQFDDSKKLENVNSAAFQLNSKGITSGAISPLDHRFWLVFGLAPSDSLSLSLFHEER